jgi:hypothetical protein
MMSHQLFVAGPWDLFANAGEDYIGTIGRRFDSGFRSYSCGIAQR